MPDTSAALSVSERIRADIERQILSGALKPGDPIPLERELMGAYDCSRMTANKAVGDLVSRGLVVRRRRAGSFVAHPPTGSTILDIPDIRLDLERRGRRYGFRLLRRTVRKARKSDADELALAGGGRLMEVHGLHEADGEPFAAERRLISLAAVPECEDADFSKTPPGTWLLQHVPWSQAEHRIFAIGAPADEAGLLGLAQGAPCLLLERRTWLKTVPVTHVWQTFPGDRHSFIGSLSRGQ